MEVLGQPGFNKTFRDEDGPSFPPPLSAGEGALRVNGSHPLLPLNVAAECLTEPGDFTHNDSLDL